MTQHTHPAPIPVGDDEIRDSIRVIQSQRNTKRVLALAALVGMLVAAFIAVYFAYSSRVGAGALPPM